MSEHGAYVRGLLAANARQAETIRCLQLRIESHKIVAERLIEQAANAKREFGGRPTVTELCISISDTSHLACELLLGHTGEHRRTGDGVVWSW